MKSSDPIDELTKTADFKKNYGEGALFRFNEKVDYQENVLPTGLWSLDNIVLGIGGLPRGRIIELFGDSSSGKTCLLQRIIASAQKIDPDKECIIVDTEMALSKDWLTRTGVDLDRLRISQPMTGEQALGMTEDLVTTGRISVIGIDSVANLVPTAELEGEIFDATMGLQAKLMSKGLRRLTYLVNKTDTILVFINQIRCLFGTMNPHAPKTLTPGGKALKFYSSVRLNLVRTGSLKENDQEYANVVKIEAVKNKMAPPFRDFTYELNFSTGFDTESDIINCGVTYGVIEQKGAWFSFKDKKFQGKNSFKEWLKSEPTVKEEILQLLNETIK